MDNKGGPRDPTTQLRALSPIHANQPRNRKASMSGWDVDELPFGDALGKIRQYHSQFSKRPEPEKTEKAQEALNAQRSSVFARLTSRRKSPLRSQKKLSLEPIRMSFSRESKTSSRLFPFALGSLQKARSNKKNTQTNYSTIESYRQSTKRKFKGHHQTPPEYCRFDEFAYHYNMKMLLESALCYNTLAGDSQGSYLPSFNTTKFKIREKSNTSRRNSLPRNQL